MRVQSLGQEEPLEGGNGSPFQYPCQENPGDRGLAGSCLWACKVGHDLATEHACMHLSKLHWLYQGQTKYLEFKTRSIIKVKDIS